MTDTTTKQPDAASRSDSGSMEKIRELLFGDLVDQTQRQFESFAKRLERQQADQESAAAGLQQSIDRLGETDESLKDELSGLHRKLTDEILDLEQRISSRIDALSSSLDETLDGLRAMMQAQTERLGREKLDQELLSASLRELADRLAKESTQ